MEYPSWQGCSTPSSPIHPELIPGIALTQVQPFELGLAKSCEVLMDPLLELVQVPLDGVPSFRCVSHATQLGVV